MLKKVIAVVLLLALLVSFAGCKKEEEKEAVKTLSVFTDIAIFKDIPAMDEEHLSVVDADDYGELDFVLVLQGMMKPGYDAYMEKLKNAGYTVFADTGEDGIGKSIYSTTFVKDNLTLTAAFMPNVARLYLTATKDKDPAPRLNYDASYVVDNIEGAKTTLTMHQLGEGGGNSYILQLKNGHFIISDGGNEGEYENLLAYLKSLVPEGEKPYIEGWFLSHAHGDHVGFMSEVGYASAKEVIVEAFYYNEVSPAVHKKLGNNYLLSHLREKMPLFVTADGSVTPVYRCHAGDRYYFSDINIEVLHTTEQLLLDDYVDNYNVSCTWLLYNIEGQKFLNAADAEDVNTRIVMDTMDKDYMDLDMMNVNHHGVNIYLDDLNYYNCETLLYSGWCTYTVYYPQEIRDGMLKMQDEYCEEYMSYLYGSIVLEFPYTVGSFKTLPSLHPERTVFYKERSIQWMKDIGRTDMPR